MGTQEQIEKLENWTYSWTHLPSSYLPLLYHSISRHTPTSFLYKILTASGCTKPFRSRAFLGNVGMTLNLGFCRGVVWGNNLTHVCDFWGPPLTCSLCIYKILPPNGTALIGERISRHSFRRFSVENPITHHSWLGFETLTKPMNDDRVFDDPTCPQHPWWHIHLQKPPKTSYPKNLLWYSFTMDAWASQCFWDRSLLQARGETGGKASSCESGLGRHGELACNPWSLWMGHEFGIPMDPPKKKLDPPRIKEMCLTLLYPIIWGLHHMFLPFWRAYI